MEYFNNILCITQPELLEVMSESNYKQMVQRGKISRARRGGNGRQALIVFDSLPGKYRSAVRERKPDISTMPLQEWLRANYTPDAEARSYFSAFRFDNGSALPAEDQRIHGERLRHQGGAAADGVGQCPATCRPDRLGGDGRDRRLLQTGVRPRCPKACSASARRSPSSNGRVMPR